MTNSSIGMNPSPCLRKASSAGTLVQSTSAPIGSRRVAIQLPRLNRFGSTDSEDIRPQSAHTRPVRTPTRDAHPTPPCESILGNLSLLPKPM
jgi:hypothetical protein